RMEDDVVSIESSVFSRQQRWLNIEPVYLLRREVLELRRAVTPLAGPLSRLASDNTLVPKEIRRQFRDVSDHMSTVIEHV
ncbi:magnesium transporter, partial [Mycobacterium tuberculosis]|nr:magnesium transporter [Mycobacterium tuberculosis]